MGLNHVSNFVLHHCSHFCLLFWRISFTLLSVSMWLYKQLLQLEHGFSHLPDATLSQKLLFKTQLLQFLIFPQQTLNYHPYQLQTEVTISQKYSLSLPVEMYLMSIIWWSALPQKSIIYYQILWQGEAGAVRVNQS